MQQQLSQWVLRLQNLYKSRPRRVIASVAVGLSVLGGTAMAVSSLSSENASQPLSQVLESVSNVSLNDLGLGTHMALYRSETTRHTDTADSLLKRLGLDDAEAAAFLRSNDTARQIVGKNGRLVIAEGDASHKLSKLTARWTTDDSNKFSRWVMERTPEGFKDRLETADLSISTHLGSGTIQSSLFAATDEADIPDSVAMQMADIFAGDIDFHRDLRKGDHFSVVYETLEADGETLRTGRVLSAEFHSKSDRYQAFWYQEASAKQGGYYNADGVSLRRAYLPSPLAFSRITSGFKMRFHPILQTWRAHLGVDFAAPTGTPVRSVGQGVVTTAGVQGGYGNVVMVQHANGHTTVYAHLSRIFVKRGQRVDQGENLGAVGSTGWATGPHLHFEFRVNGKQQDPRIMARQSQAITLSAASRSAFKQYAAQASAELAAASIQNSGAE